MALTVVAAFVLMRRPSTSRDRPSSVVPGPVVPATPPPPEPLVDRAPKACHAEKLTAQSVPIETGFTDAPRAPLAGGKLTDGVYDVVKYVVYGTPPQGALRPAFRQTIYIQDGGATAKNVRVGMQGRLETTTWSSEINGTEMVWTGVCPEVIRGTRENIQFGAEGDKLIMGFEQAGLPVQITYRRRNSF